MFSLRRYKRSQRRPRVSSSDPREHDRGSGLWYPLHNGWYDARHVFSYAAGRPGKAPVRQHKLHDPQGSDQLERRCHCFLRTRIIHTFEAIISLSSRKVCSLVRQTLLITRRSDVLYTFCFFLEICY